MTNYQSKGYTGTQTPLDTGPTGGFFDIKITDFGYDGQPIRTKWIIGDKVIIEERQK